MNVDHLIVKGQCLISLYARSPSDLRLFRIVLERLKLKEAHALYVGVGTGEDLYSWLPVGWGVCPGLEWTAMDNIPKAIKDCKAACPLPVNWVVQDLFKGLPKGKFDFIIAPHCWELGSYRNGKALREMFKARPYMVIARDHKLPPRRLENLAAKYGFKVYQHALKRDFHCSNSWPHIFINETKFRLELTPDDYVQIKPAIEAKGEDDADRDSDRPAAEAPQQALQEAQPGESGHSGSTPLGG